MRRRSGERPDAAWCKPKVLVIFTLIFLSGLATGAAVTRSFFHPHPKTEPTLQTLRESLDLTHDQERVVIQVLDDYAKYYENLEDDRRSVAEHGKRQILQVLRPDQQKRFLALFGSPWIPAHAAETDASN